MSDTSDAESDQESLDTVVSDLMNQMKTLEALSADLTTHVTDLFQRTKRETTDWMHEPLRPISSIEAWCVAQGLS